MAISPAQQVLARTPASRTSWPASRLPCAATPLPSPATARTPTICHATLVKLYLVWDRLSDRDHLGGYARTTMTRTHVSLWRSWGRREVAVAALPETSAPPTSDAVERDLIWRGLSRLGRRQRAIVVLRYYEDLDLNTIAKELGISVGTVKSQLSRALGNLRTSLEGADHDS